MAEISNRAPAYGVRLAGQYYEVYRLADFAAVVSFHYTTEAERAVAMGRANITRNDMNAEARKAKATGAQS